MSLLPQQEGALSRQQDLSICWGPPRPSPQPTRGLCQRSSQEHGGGDQRTGDWGEVELSDQCASGGLAFGNGDPVQSGGDLTGRLAGQ